jgi:hypothetical protein
MRPDQAEFLLRLLPQLRSEQAITKKIMSAAYGRKGARDLCGKRRRTLSPESWIAECVRRPTATSRLVMLPTSPKS